MNVERINAVADAIEKEAFGFKYDQGVYVTRYGCGSAACIIGMAALLMTNGDTSRVSVDDPNFDRANHIESKTVHAWLGLTFEEADAIYFAEGRNYELYPMMSDVPATQAVRTLRHLAATGEVDWTV